MNILFSRFAPAICGLAMMEFVPAAVLISNSSTTSAYTSSGGDLSSNSYRVMRFTTPAYPTQLQSVEAVVAIANLGVIPTVEIRTGSVGNNPGTVVHTMTPPSSFPLGVRFRTYTTTGFTFAASTTYGLSIRLPITSSVGSWYRLDSNLVPTGLATFVNTIVTYNGSTFNTDSLRPYMQVVVADPVRTVTGSLTLNDTVGSFAVARTIGYSVVQGTSVVQTGSVTSSGTTTPFSLSLPLATTGAVQVRFDGSSFLRKSVAVTLSGTTNAVGSVVLSNGDVDASGEVDAADIDEVIAAFGDTTSGATDVDVSGEVDAADIDIVIANFGGVDN